MSIGSGHFLGSLCPCLCSSLRGVRLQGASVSCHHPHHRCSSLHVLLAQGWVLQARVGRWMLRATPMKDKTLDWAAGCSVWNYFAWAALASVDQSQLRSPAYPPFPAAPSFLALSTCSDSPCICHRPPLLPTNQSVSSLKARTVVQLTSGPWGLAQSSPVSACSPERSHRVHWTGRQGACPNQPTALDLPCATACAPDVHRF